MGTDHYERRTTDFHSGAVLQVHVKRGLCGEQSSCKRAKPHKQCTSSQPRPLPTWETEGEVSFHTSFKKKAVKPMDTDGD